MSLHRAALVMFLWTLVWYPSVMMVMADVEEEADEENPAAATTTSNATSTTKTGIPEGDFIVPEDGWTTEELQCLNDMDDSDESNYDHVLNHHEYIIFCDTMANRMFDLPDAVTEETEWKLSELYEDLVLKNPSGSVAGVDILGAAYGELDNVDDAQTKFLKMVCRETHKALYKIGPDDIDNDEDDMDGIH